MSPRFPSWRQVWRFERRVTVTYPTPHAEPEPIQLPADVHDASTAIEMLVELWPILVDALEPGSGSHRYGRRTERRIELGACDTCGGERLWRPATFPLGLPPADPRLAGGHLGPVERLRRYCPLCDRLGSPKLAATPLPISVAVHDALVDAESGIRAVEEYAAGAVGLTPLAAAADVLDRLDHLDRLLPAIYRYEALAGDVTESLLALVRAVRRAIRDVELVIKIDAPARCPWCRGRSLVMWPHRGDTNPHLIAGQMTFARGLVECTQRDCLCTEPACPCKRRFELAGGHQPYAGYRHQWSNAEWRELGEQIGVDLHAIAERGSDQT